jgi:hypothetical protein
MKAPQKIDRIYKIYRIDFLPPHLVNLVNPVYFLRFRALQRDIKDPAENQFVVPPLGGRAGCKTIP